MIRVGDRSLAEDLVQDTFMSGLKAKDNFKGDSTERTWLVAILKNKIIDHYRQKDVLKNAREYLAQTEENFSENFFDASNGHWLARAAPQLWSEPADSELNTFEFNQVLQGCVRTMPPRLAAVFIARFIDEEESEVICKEQNLSSSNYWVIVHRAKVLIRSCLEKKWFVKKGN